MKRELASRFFPIRRGGGLDLCICCKCNFFGRRLFVIPFIVHKPGQMIASAKRERKCHHPS
jgi:hypothetical protein